MHIRILDKQPREALGTIGQALDWDHHPNIDMLQGVIVENMTSLEREHQQTCLERAEAAFLACVTHDAKISARDSLPGVTTWAANTRLGTVRLTRGDVDGAQLAFEAALESDPEHAEATIGLLECWLESGDGARILEPLMPYMGIADAWMLAAAACEEMGRLEDALLFVGQAHELQENGLQASMHRNLRMLELLSMAGLYTGKPLSGPGPWGALGAVSRDNRSPPSPSRHLSMVQGRTPRHSLRDCGLGDMVEPCSSHAPSRSHPASVMLCDERSRHSVQRRSTRMNRPRSSWAEPGMPVFVACRVRSTPTATWKRGKRATHPHHLLAPKRVVVRHGRRPRGCRYRAPAG